MTEEVILRGVVWMDDGEDDLRMERESLLLIVVIVESLYKMILQLATSKGISRQAQDQNAAHLGPSITTEMDIISVHSTGSGRSNTTTFPIGT